MFSYLTEKGWILTQLILNALSVYAMFDFQFQAFRDFLCLQIDLTLSKYELKKCFLKKDGILPEID